MIEAVLLAMSQLLISTPNPPICTNTYVQEERKWSRLISFIGNLKLKQNLYQWVNNSEVSGTQKKSIRNLASMLSRGNLKKKSKKKIMWHPHSQSPPIAGDKWASFYFKYFTAMDRIRQFSDYETGIGACIWGVGKLPKCYLMMAKRECSRSAIMSVIFIKSYYLRSNGSLFKQVPLKFPNIENNDVLIQDWIRWDRKTGLLLFHFLPKQQPRITYLSPASAPGGLTGKQSRGEGTKEAGTEKETSESPLASPHCHIPPWKAP